MRALLHFGLFVLALTIVGQASADHDDDDRRREDQGEDRGQQDRAAGDQDIPLYHGWLSLRGERQDNPVLMLS